MHFKVWFCENNSFQHGYVNEMRKRNNKGRCEKQMVSKCADVCRSGAVERHEHHPNHNQEYCKEGNAAAGLDWVV